tara:strand:- start:8801 stop:10480 length:1680 start_codon:yes stop_codon:yes gene_type:complete
MEKIEIYKELYKRGAIPEDKLPIFNELVERGQIELDVDPRVQKAREFEETIPGKILGFPRTLLGQRKLSEEIQRGQELKGMPFGQRLKETALDVGKDVATAAPMLVGRPGTGALGRRALTPLMGDMAITGISKAAEEGLEGASAKDALLAGGGAGATAGIIGKAIPSAAKFGGLAAKEIGHILSKPASDEIIDGLVRYPNVLKENVPQMNVAAEKASDLINAKVKKEGTVLDKQLGAMIKELPKGAFVDVRGIPEIYKKNQIDKSLARDVKKQFKRMKEAIGPREEKILDVIEKGGKLTMTEAREANSLLGRLVRKKPTDSFPQEAIDKVDIVKSYILDQTSSPKIQGAQGANIRIQLPESQKMKKLNEKFAKVKSNADFVQKKLIDPRSTRWTTYAKQEEGRRYGQEGLGRTKNKTDEILALEKLGKEGKSARELLEKSYIIEKLDEPQTGNLFRAGVGAGFGGTLGSFLGDPATGALLGGSAALLPVMPTVPRKIASGMARGVRAGRKAAPYIDTAARLGGKVAGREMFNASQRTPAGNYSPTYQDQIINERFRRTR